MKPHVRFLYRLMYDAPKEGKAVLGGGKDPFAVKIVGYTMMCYRAPDDERQQAAIHHPARKKDSE